jgi:hypothetical protein
MVCAEGVGASMSRKAYLAHVVVAYARNVESKM